jgi:hypothetical protein
MNKGCYFETLCLGSGYNGKKVEDLTRKKDGSKTVDQQRIELQHLRFGSFVNKYGMVVIPEINTQTVIYKQFPEDPDVVLRCDMDIHPTPIMTKTRGMIMATIDLKLTGDIRSSHGMFSWASAASLDPIQAVMYLEAGIDVDFDFNDKMGNYKLVETYRQCDILNSHRYIEPHFFYMVFDYSPQTRVKIIEVRYDAHKQRELYENIKLMATEIRVNNDLDKWSNTCPSKENCSQCSCNCDVRFVEDVPVYDVENSEFDDIEYESI